MKRRTEITIETNGVLVMRVRTEALTAWCPRCRAHVTMVTPDQAAIMSNTGSQAIYRLVENERPHYTETNQGTMLICVNSLLV